MKRQRIAVSLCIVGTVLVLGSAAPSFADGKHASPPPNPSGCGENSFLGGLIPSDGSTVGPGATIGAVYQDETPLNTSTLSFTVDGVAVTPVLTNISSGHGDDGQYATRITYTLPTDFAPGVHQARLYAEDSDQNKTGGDCGVATWSFTVAAPAPSPSPSASPSPAPSSSPTSAPPPSQTATPAITTHVLGSEISRPAPAAAVASQLPATGVRTAVLLVLGLALIGWGVALRLPKPAKQQ